MKFVSSEYAVASVLPKLKDKVLVQPADIEIILPRKREKERASGRCPEVPLTQKELLTLREAAAYTGIGINRLRRMSDDEHCNFVLWSGSKRLLKRRELEKYLAEAYSV